MPVDPIAAVVEDGDGDDADVDATATAGHSISSHPIRSML